MLLTHHNKAMSNWPKYETDLGARAIKTEQESLRSRRDRLNIESGEQREARLEHSRDQTELASESPEERQARLQRVRANHRERLATDFTCYIFFAQCI